MMFTYSRKHSWTLQWHPPPQARWSEPLCRAMNTSTVALNPVCQRGLSTHQMIRIPRARNWVQFTTIQCSAGSLDPIGTLFILQIFTKHRVAQKTEQGLPLKSDSHKKRTVNPPLSCSYPIKSNWHRVQPGGDTASKWLPHSVLQGRKQSVAKETSGTEKKYLIQSFLIPR